MRRLKLFAVLFVLLCGSYLSAKDFDWSECWCNYGGGIKQGDFLVNVDAGFLYQDFEYSTHDDFWFFPPVMVEVQYVQPIWKLPLSFGGYAGIHGFGYKKIDHYTSEEQPVYKTYTYWGVFFGAEAAYHIQLPPESLDVYAVTRFGGNIPFVKNRELSHYDYIHFGEALGASWFFGEHAGLNIEFGYPFSKCGVILKF